MAPEQPPADHLLGGPPLHAAPLYPGADHQPHHEAPHEADHQREQLVDHAEVAELGVAHHGAEHAGQDGAHDGGDEHAGHQGHAARLH